jgi:hypothetical protein
MGYKTPSHQQKIHSRNISAGETCEPGMKNCCDHEPVGPKQSGAKKITHEDFHPSRPEHLVSPVGSDGGEASDYDSNAST